MLTEDDKKLLTEEVLGEVWWLPVGSGQTAYCNGIYVPPQENRTFTTWQDTGDLKQRIVEMGEWEEFIKDLIGIWESKNDYIDKEIHCFTSWLIDPIRFPELVASWTKERRVEG